MQNKSNSLNDLDNITPWEKFSFDGANSPSTGVLCKFADGTIAFFDPRVHAAADVRFVESDDPEVMSKRDQIFDGFGGLACFLLVFGLPFVLAFFDKILDKLIP